MTNDFIGLFNTRLAKDTDKNFVLATFLRGLYYGESLFSEMPKDLFMNKYKHVVQALINDPNTEVVVACLPEDSDVILGYSIVSKNKETLYWVFVKAAWRRKGVAKSLIAQNPKYIAHLTKLGSELRYKLPNAKFNPLF